MSEGLPEIVEAGRLAERRAQLHGVIELERLPRLAGQLVAPSTAEVSVEFESGSQGMPCLIGQVSAELPVECQRCLDTLVICARPSFRFAVVDDSSQADPVPEGYEPLLAAGLRVRLWKLIEDELLLALPLSPRHGHGECGELAELIDRYESSREQRTSPFAALKKIPKPKDMEN